MSEWALAHPWLTFFLLLSLFQVVHGILVVLPSRVLRTLNIRKAGWPPPHIDGDADRHHEAAK